MPGHVLDAEPIGRPIVHRRAVDDQMPGRRARERRELGMRVLEVLQRTRGEDDDRTELSVEEEREHVEETRHTTPIL